MSGKYQIPSVHRAIDILYLLSSKERMSFTAIKDTLELANSTCFNLLNTLEKRGFVQRDNNNQYLLGIRLMQFGLSVYNNFDLSKVSKPYLRELSNEFEETTYLTVLDKTDSQGLIIDCIHGDRTGLVYSRNIGEIIPLYASGTGKSLLSGFDTEELNQFFEDVKLIPFTPQTITDKEVLLEELEEIRANGYAISQSAFEEGVISISAPITDYTGAIIASLSLVGPINRINIKLAQVIDSVKSTAKSISNQLS